MDTLRPDDRRDPATASRAPRDHLRPVSPGTFPARYARTPPCRGPVSYPSSTCSATRRPALCWRQGGPWSERGRRDDSAAVFAAARTLLGDDVDDARLSAAQGLFEDDRRGNPDALLTAAREILPEKHLNDPAGLRLRLARQLVAEKLGERKAAGRRGPVPAGYADIIRLRPATVRRPAVCGLSRRSASLVTPRWSSSELACGTRSSSRPTSTKTRRLHIASTRSSRSVRTGCLAGMRSATICPGPHTAPGCKRCRTSFTKT